MLDIERVRTDLREFIGDFRIEDYGDSCEITMPFYDYYNQSIKLFVSEYENGYQIDDGGTIVSGKFSEDERLIGKVISLCKTYRGYFDRSKHIISIRAGVTELPARILDLVHALLGVSAFIRVFCIGKNANIITENSNNSNSGSINIEPPKNAI
jgi:hypothetical protein